MDMDWQIFAIFQLGKVIGYTLLILGTLMINERINLGCCMEKFGDYNNGIPELQ